MVIKQLIRRHYTESMICGDYADAYKDHIAIFQVINYNPTCD